MRDIPVEAVICIPSFRRPEGLRRTLASIAAQRTDIAFAVVVIDNDRTSRQAVAVARQFFAESGVAGVTAVEENQGNCHAINAAFGLARATFAHASYFLMIDDDEAASAGWLSAMVDAARRFDADIVGGPVTRVFDRPVDASISAHPLFGSIDARTGPIPIIHGSGNCLIARRVFEELDQPRFDPHFNFLGGGDMDFFTRARAQGCRFAWCEEALITEFVAADRLSAGWLMNRSIRTGTINYTMDRLRASTFGRRVLLAGKNVVSLGLSVGRMTNILIRTGRPLSATHPILMSIGRIMGSLGIVPTPYKERSRTAEPPHA